MNTFHPAAAPEPARWLRYIRTILTNPLTLTGDVETLLPDRTVEIDSHMRTFCSTSPNQSRATVVIQTRQASAASPQAEPRVGSLAEETCRCGSSSLNCFQTRRLARFMYEACGFHGRPLAGPGCLSSPQVVHGFQSETSEAPGRSGTLTEEVTRD